MVPLIITLALGADPAAYPNDKLLVEAGELARADAKAFRVLDVRPRPQYQGGHVPGAVWADVAAWSQAVARTPDDTKWPERLAAVGIEPKAPVVVYADDVRDAARAWWVLKFAGVPVVRILNGGWRAWEEGKHPVEKKENTAKADPAAWKAEKSRLTTKEQLLDFVKAKKVQVLDARSEGEFCGETKTAKRAGSVPGAVRLEWSELIDPKTKKFRPAPELKKLIDDRKIDLGKEAVTYCQSGGRAAVLAFGLELMGGTKVSNYYRSWAEWGNADDTPVAKPDR